MSAAKLLAELRQLNVELRVAGDRLHFTAPAGTLTAYHREALAAYKPELIVLLTGPPRGVVAASPLRASIRCPSPAPTPGPTRFQFGSPGWPTDYRLVDTQAKFRGFLEQLKEQRYFVFDLETTGLDATTARIVGFAFCWQAAEAYYVPVMAPRDEAKLDYDATLSGLKPLFENPEIGKANQNVKYDLLVLRRHGVHVAGVQGDPMLADYLLRPGAKGHNLDDMAAQYLNYQTIPITDLIGKKGSTQLRMDQVPVQKVANYAAEDADVAFRLEGYLVDKLGSQSMQSLYYDLEVPLVEVLVEMEANGVRIDVSLLSRLSGELGGKIKGLERDIYSLAGYHFNLNSSPQLGKLLFLEKKLPRQGVTKGGISSTDKETLDKLARLGYELPAKLLKYRQLTKLKSTYVDTLPRLVSRVTGRLHTSFNQAVTVTGRLSSSKPNLQNIPARSDLGRKIRQAFLPTQGWSILKADYSQIELRLLAHFCSDDELKRAFRNGLDIHALVASQVFKVAEADITADQRRFAKTINFGVIYGMSAYGLANRL